MFLCKLLFYILFLNRIIKHVSKLCPFFGQCILICQRQFAQSISVLATSNARSITVKSNNIRGFRVIKLSLAKHGLSENLQKLSSSPLKASCTIYFRKLWNLQVVINILSCFSRATNVKCHFRANPRRDCTFCDRCCCSGLGSKEVELQHELWKLLRVPVARDRRINPHWVKSSSNHKFKQHTILNLSSCEKPYYKCCVLQLELIIDSMKRMLTHP